AVAMPMVRVDLAARLRVGVERARHPSAGVHRQRYEVGQRSERVAQAGEEVLVGAALDGLVWCRAGDEGVGRPIDDLLIGLVSSGFGRVGRLEIEWTGVHLTAERQAPGAYR